MSDDGSVSSPEKWLDVVQLATSEDDEEAAQALGEQVLRNGLAAIPDLTQLPTTNFERSAMASFVEQINFLRGKCSLNPIRVSSERLHIVDDDDFKAEIGPTTSGYEMLGRIYLPEHLRQNPKHFAYALSHEIGHLSSFTAAWLEWAGTGDQAKITEAYQVVTGLQRMSDVGEPQYLGLNEAVTEYLAAILRTLVARGLGSFSKHCAITGNRIDTGYSTTVALFAALCRELAKGYRDDWTCATDVWRTLLIDYWSGSQEFAGFLSGTYPAMLADIQALGTESDEAEQLALRYGLVLDSTV